MIGKPGRFNQKLVLITGGSSGIGAALAELFAKEGANVWLLARREAILIRSLNNIKNSSQHNNHNHGYIICDVSNESEVELAIDQLIHDSGIPDIVVNCAGVVHPGEFLELDQEKFDWMMDINFFGTVHVIRKVLPGMIERGTGHIVNISSMAAIVGLFGYSAYAASKSAVLSFSEALQFELKSKGIAVTIVLPTDTDTEQLHYEEKYRPPEIKAFARLGIIHSADSVANEIIAGITRKKFMILPGIDAKFLYWAVKILGNGVFPVIDWLSHWTLLR